MESFTKLHRSLIITRLPQISANGKNHKSMQLHKLNNMNLKKCKSVPTTDVAQVTTSLSELDIHYRYICLSQIILSIFNKCIHWLFFLLVIMSRWHHCCSSVVYLVAAMLSGERLQRPVERRKLREKEISINKQDYNEVQDLS